MVPFLTDERSSSRGMWKPNGTTIAVDLGLSMVRSMQSTCYLSCSSQILHSVRIPRKLRILVDEYQFPVQRFCMVRVKVQPLQDSSSGALGFRVVQFVEQVALMASLRASISLPGVAVASPRVASRRESLSVVVPHVGGNGGFATSKRGPLIAEIPLEYIRRPLLRTRNNDPVKVKELMESIAEIGLQEPIDVLEVEGVYYGFSGCHRYEAHQKLGLPTIKCKIRRGTRETLRHHLR